MPRPCCLRHVNHSPAAVYFKPAGVPACTLEQVTLTLDEVEALRLADLQGLYQEEAGRQMKVSRATFARIVESARRKVADALIHGKALRLEGGTITIKGETNTPGKAAAGPNRAERGAAGGSCGCGQRGKGRCRCWRNESENASAADATKHSSTVKKNKGK